MIATLPRLAHDARFATVARYWRAFRPALAGQKHRIGMSLGLAFAATALELLKPWPVTWVIDGFLMAAVRDSAALSTRRMIELGAVAALAVVVPALLGYVSEWLDVSVAKVSRTATVRIRGRVFEHLQRLELREHQRRHSGDLVMRLMGDVNLIRDMLLPSWVTLISGSSLMLGTAVVFALVDPWLFVVALIPVPVLTIFTARTSRVVKKAANKQRRREGQIASQAAESLRRVELVKAFVAEEQVAREFHDTVSSAEHATLVSTRQAARMRRITELLTGTGVALVLALGSVRVLGGHVTPGELLVALSYARLMYKPLRQITAEGARLAKASASAARVVDLLELPIEHIDHAGRIAPLAGTITLNDVHHVYPDGRDALHGLTASIPAGSLVAITGENGTGKSTLLSLLLRLHQPSRGGIEIDGRPIDAYPLGAYRRQIAYVPQELQLFGGTILENIAFARPDASQDEIVEAARAALLLPVIEQLPQGFQTVLGEAGASLSGGQARRLMLARAALRDARIVLLDEPLAGLDPDARDTVAAAIRNIAAGRTTLVVHHGSLEELGPDLEVRVERPATPALGAPSLHPGLHCTAGALAFVVPRGGYA